ncbi:MAG: hypothetical protein ACJ76H_09340 [Bacteriovoracaceae bacterium]
MKTIIALLLVFSCANKNTRTVSSDSNWDSGAQKQQSYRTEQAQEQVDATNMQFTTPGSNGASQALPH